VVVLVEVVEVVVLVEVVEVVVPVEVVVCEWVVVDILEVGGWSLRCRQAGASHTG
jgi:hypothetical protein